MWAIAPWSKKAKWWVTGVGLGIPLLSILVSAALLFINISPTKQFSAANDAKKRADVQTISTEARRFCLKLGRCPNNVLELKDQGYLKEIPLDPETKTYYLYQLTGNGKDCLVKTTLSTKEEFSIPCTSSNIQ
ncbi:MAG: hypothetical protein Q7T59_05535 [Candidatus Woesebacteria bacterium]|nr:hypothetical protein [Candidatus Woesebacteria bacterium]